MVWLRVSSRRNLSYPSRRSSPNSRRLILLQTVCRRQKSQLLCNQANPNSFAKTPGVGVSPSSVPLCLCGNPDLSPLAKDCKSTATATLTTFRINTRKSVSKQRTLTPFRINTYKKTGEGGALASPPVENHQLPRLRRRQRPSSAPRGASIPSALTRLRILPVAIGAPPPPLPTFRSPDLPALRRSVSPFPATLANLPFFNPSSRHTSAKMGWRAILLTAPVAHPDRRRTS